MSLFDDVFGSLNSMSQLQLLMAFIACTAYAIAQGKLLPEAGKTAAWVLAVSSATAFAIDSVDWTLATVLIGFAVAGMGSFVAAVWLMSRALGLARTDTPVTFETPSIELDSGAIADGPVAVGSTARAPHHTAAMPSLR